MRMLRRVRRGWNACICARKRETQRESLINGIRSRTAVLTNVPDKFASYQLRKTIAFVAQLKRYET
jgi:hypothetical protein